MDYKIRAILFCAAIFFFVRFGCSPSTETETNTHDEQFIQIHLQYGFVDDLNTFTGTFTKDLVKDGSITVEFWLSKSQQECIILKVEQLSFFNLPDKIPPLEGQIIEPNPGPDMLQISYNNLNKTIVWDYPLDPEDNSSKRVIELSDYIMSIVRESQIFKELPLANGARL
jgi:hypothetical protein